MGTYIINFDDKPWQDLDDAQYYRCKEIPWFSTTKTTISRLTPYTEPDMEQVRKEAYQQGLNDTREGKASCQFCEYEMCSDRVDPCRICACNYMNFFEPKKQEKEEQIRVGDEVTMALGKAVVTGVGPVHFEYVNADGYGYDEVKNVKKTGRHFPEIAEVLQKMRETT